MEICKIFTAKGEPVYYINRFYYTNLVKWLKLLNHLQENFLQNYIIHGCYQNKSTLPCVFSFLPEKSRQAYRHLFNCMKLAAEEYKIELKPVHHIHRIILRIFHNFFKPIKFMHTFSFHAFFQKNSASADIFLCSHKLI